MTVGIYPKAEDLMADEPILRSPDKMNAADFAVLMKLTSDMPWLQKVSAGLIELWNVCASKEERELIVDLIKRMRIVDSNDLEDAGEKIAHHITNHWGCAAEATRIVAVSDDAFADGSQALLQSIKNKFSDEENWSGNGFVNSLSEGVKDARKILNLVLLDDFIGTGRTIIRRIKWAQKAIEKQGVVGVRILVVALAGMEFCRQEIEENGVEVFCYAWLKKGISENEKMTEVEKDMAKQRMIRLETELGTPYKGLHITQHSLGYKKTEALFAQQAYNVPNNVFPIFWWPINSLGKQRLTLLRRVR